jgi:hypothetical protein
VILVTLDGKSGRAPTPSRSTTLDQPSIAPEQGSVARFKAIVWAWRLRIPSGPAGHRYLAALERQLAVHLARNLEAMRRDGWLPDQAEAAAREWLRDLADTAARIAFENGGSR